MSVESDGMGDPVGFGFVPEAILALAALGELDRAELLLSIWDERARELDRALALAMGGRCRAVIAGARGDWAAADDAIAEALREHKRVDAPIELGRYPARRGSTATPAAAEGRRPRVARSGRRAVRAMRCRAVGAAGA